MAKGYFRVDKNICLYCGATHGQPKYNVGDEIQEVRRVARNLFLCKHCAENSGYDWNKCTPIDKLKTTKL